MRPTTLRPALDRQKNSGLQTDILLLLLSSYTGEGAYYPPVPTELKELIVSNQPQSGDILLSIIANPAHSFRRRAARAFSLAWDSMSAQQIQTYVQCTLRLTAGRRERYPQGMKSAVGMGYHLLRVPNKKSILALHL